MKRKFISNVTYPKTQLSLSCQMNAKYIFIVAAIAVMLIGRTALATEVAFAKFGKSQAVTQVNACGNGDMPMNIGCQKYCFSNSGR